MPTPQELFTQALMQRGGEPVLMPPQNPVTGPVSQSMPAQRAAAALMGIGEGLYKGFTAPGRAYQSKEPITTDEMIEPAMNMVDLLATGGLPMAQKGAFGIFGGKGAKGADYVELTHAKTMENMRAHPDDIWYQTGWYRGPDDKWRFEIDDSKSGFKNDALVKVAAKKQGDEPLLSVPGNFRIVNDKMIEGTPVLRELFNHNPLYKNYSDVSGIPIQPMPTNNALGAYIPGSGSPNFVFEHIKLAPGSKDNLRDVLLHELQHATQAREGFAFGGSPQTFYSPATKQLHEALQNSFTDVKNILIKSGYDGPAAKNAIQQIIDMNRGRPYDFNVIKNLEKSGDFDRLRTYAEGLDLFQTQHAKSFDKYKTLAGEVEANNVQNRKNLSPLLRREVPPWYTQDVPFEQQILSPNSQFEAGSAVSNMVRALLGK